MDLEASLDATVADAGVEFTYTVENVSDEPAELTLRSGKKADVAVYDASDPEGLPRRARSPSGGAETRSGTPDDEPEPDPVWRWSDGQMFTQALESRTIDAGEETTFTFTWEEPDSGEYVGVATLDSETACPANAEFTV